MLNGKSILITGGTGSFGKKMTQVIVDTRSFCYVDDLIDGLVKLMNSPDNFIGPVNLGNPDEFSILELAQMIIKMTDSKSKIVFKPLPQDDPMQRRPDISLARKHLDWEPKIKLDEGLKKTVDYFDDLLRRRSSI